MSISRVVSIAALLAIAVAGSTRAEAEASMPVGRSVGAIEQARLDGTIDSAEAALYKLIALHDQSRLPAAFQFDDGIPMKCATQVALEASARLGEMPPAMRREAEALAAAHPNVWLEWCGSFCSTIPWEESFSRVNPAKMIFGSDAFCHNLVWELGRLLSVDLPQEQVRPMLGDTMRRLLALRH